MASKSKLKISIEPVSIIAIIVITVVVFLLNKFFPDWNLTKIFSSVEKNGRIRSKPPVLFIFGTKEVISWVLFIPLLFVARELETYYGTVLFILMILISSIFTEVLLFCFSTKEVMGIAPVFCLTIFLDLFENLRKKTLPISTFFCLIFFVIFELREINTENIIIVLIYIAGGLCGSLISFFTVKRSSGKKTSSKKNEKAQTVVYFDNEEDSPRFKNKKNKKSSIDDDTTVIGTIEL